MLCYPLVLYTGISEDKMFNSEKFSAEDQLLLVSMSHDQGHFLRNVANLVSRISRFNGYWKKKDPGNEV